MNGRTDRFPTDPTGLPTASSPETLDLSDGAEVVVRVAPVSAEIAGAKLRMLAYNGSIPGPTLRVRQGSRLTVHAVNDGDLETTIHWHGLRLDNRFDGTTLVQSAIPVGGRFTYHLEFPDPGLYWFHPHIREDYGQEIGLSGTIVVTPSDPDYWPAVDRELVVTLDDLLVEDGAVAPFERSRVTFSAMGRYGNVLLLNGTVGPTLEGRVGEVLRLFLLNSANARVFELAIPGAPMKLVGGDSGRRERDELVTSVRIAPSERAVVDVLLERVGSLAIEHRTPRRTDKLGSIAVSAAGSGSSKASKFFELRTDADLAAERLGLGRFLEAEPDKVLSLVATMDMGAPAEGGGPTVYGCPMHPEVRSDTAGKCPKCGMKLLPVEAGESQGHGHDAAPHHDGGHSHMHDDHSDEAGGGDGIEWEDDMVAVNRRTTPENTRWRLVDGATGSEGRAIDWRFDVGERVKIRIRNEMDSDHPMHHPFHVHGAGRFLVLARNGVVESNLGWKDTVLIPTGQTVDLLLEVTNPGHWMAHCHIAEHHESGMMMTFRVD